MDQQRLDLLTAEAQEVTKEVRDARAAWLAAPRNSAREKGVYVDLVAEKTLLNTLRLAGERQLVLQLHISMHVRTMQPQIPEQEFACNVHIMVFHA